MVKLSSTHRIRIRVPSSKEQKKEQHSMTRVEKKDNYYDIPAEHTQSVSDLRGSYVKGMGTVVQRSPWALDHHLPNETATTIDTHDFLLLIISTVRCS